MKFPLLKRRRSFLSSWISLNSFPLVSQSPFFSFFFFLKVKTRLRCFQVNVEIVLWNYHCMQEDNGGIVFLFFQFLSRLRSSLFLFFSFLAKNMEWKICWKKYLGNGDLLYKLGIVKFLSWPRRTVYVYIYIKFDTIVSLRFLED